MKKKGNYFRLKGVESPYYNLKQANRVVLLINKGLSGAEVGRKIGLSRARISMIYFTATGRKISSLHF